MNNTLKSMFHQHIHKQKIYEQVVNVHPQKTKSKYVMIILCTLLIMIGISYQQTHDLHTFSIYAFNEQGIKQDLKINSEILLNQYNKSQSQVPGYPIQITINQNNQYDKIKITMNDGCILTWNPDNGIVEEHGKSYLLTHTETIYLDINASTSAQLLAIKGKKTIASQLLKFTCDSQYNFKGKSYTPNIFIE